MLAVLIMIMLPSNLTVDDPSDVSDDMATFGYGIGIGGPGGAGVLQTSGNAVDIPLLPLCETDILLTSTVSGIVSLRYAAAGANTVAARLFPSEAPHTRIRSARAYRFCSAVTPHATFNTPLAAPLSPIQSAGCQISVSP